MGEHDWALAYAIDVREGDEIHAIGDVPRTVAECKRTPVHNPVMRLIYEDGTSRAVGKLDRLLIHDQDGAVAKRLADLRAEAYGPIDGG